MKYKEKPSKINELYEQEKKKSKKRYVIPAILFAGAGLVYSLISCEKDSQSKPVINNIALDVEKVKLKKYSTVPDFEYRAIEQIGKKYFKDQRIYFLKLNVLQDRKNNRINFWKLYRFDVEKIPEELNVFTQLETLDLMANKISKIENLDNLTQLKKLLLAGNQITRIENLDSLTQLQCLTLGDRISKIEGLDKLTQLETLDLRCNQITKIENLDKLTQLKSLNLGHNQITKIQNLENLTQLQHLVLVNNHISQIENLDRLTQLKWLNLEKNPLSNQAKKYLQELRRKGIDVNY